MYFFYIDESGNTGRNLNSPDEPIHWIVGLGVESTLLPQIEHELRDLAREYCPQLASEPAFEFHGAALFHGKAPFDDLTPQQRVDLYRRVVRLVRRHDLTVFIRGIHKERHRDRAARRGYWPDHPHRLGFMFLVERIDEWLEENQPAAPSDPPLYGLLVADEQRGVERDIIESLPHWRESGTDFGYKIREIKYLVDTLHTVPSHDSWLIQLVDCLAYLQNRRRKVRLRYGSGPGANLDSSSQAVRDMYSRYMDPQVVVHHTWPQGDLT